MGMFSKIKKKVKKGFKKVGDAINDTFIRPSKEIGADFVRAAGGYFGVPGIGNVIGDYLEPGDTQAQNVYERSQQEYWRNVNEQERFARMGLQWRVEDARKAGIHPLAALGFAGPQFSPVYDQGGYDDGYDYSAMGQDIARAVYNTSTKKERAAAAASAALFESEQLRNIKLQNDALEIDILYNTERLRRVHAGSGPGIPEVEENKMGQRDIPSVMMQVRNRDGSTSWIIDPQYSDSITENPASLIEIETRNRITPAVQNTRGEYGDYAYDFDRGAWYPVSGRYTWDEVVAGAKKLLPYKYR